MANNNELMRFVQQAHMSIGGGNAAFYTPHYDLTNLGIIAMEEMWEDLVAEEPAPMIRDAMEKFNISKEELVKTYNLFIEANERITGPYRSETVDTAFREVGYFDTRMEVRMLIDALWGRALLGAFWYTVRDKIIPGEKIQKFIQYDKLESLFKASIYQEGDKNESLR